MYEKSERLKRLGEKVINENAKFFFITAYDCNIAYMECDKPKSSSGKIVYADCQKVNDKMKGLTGYDFVITFYSDSVPMSDEQKAILMEHELMHIGYTEEGKRSIVPHDLEDFREIISKYGVDWNMLGE